jgi:hypothetical protein
MSAVPNVIEAAASGRSSCRGCGGKIAKGELRFGERKPNPFGDGEATYWFHLVCAACMRSEELLPTLDAEPSAPQLDGLRATAQTGRDHPRLERLVRAERSPSSRARCRSCRTLIEKDGWRLSLGIFEEGRMEPIGFIHVACAATYFETDEVLPRVELLCPELSVEERDQIARGLTEAPPAGDAALAKPQVARGPGEVKVRDGNDESEPRRRRGSG